MKINQNMPQLKIDDEFYGICRQILLENKSLEEWSQIESDDMFQSTNYCGGFDGIEQEFCFSFYDSNNKEWWFQFSLMDVKRIISKEIQFIDMREVRN